MNRKAFFYIIRGSLFDGSLSASQVSGIDAILDMAEKRRTPLHWLAYELATTHHETSRAMQPIIETRQPGEKTNPSVDEAIRRLERSWASGKMPWVKTAYWRKDADGKSWLGRGLPQVTHKRNYEMVDKKLGLGGRLVANPDLMFTPEVAIPTLFRGMEEGWFTAHRLTPVTEGAAPYRAWRRIINGTESDVRVAGYARAYEAALRTAGYGITPAYAPATPAPKTEPDAASKKGWLASFLSNWRKQS